MRLKSSIFLWVSLATVIPLSALVLGITAYSERLYRHNVDETIQGGIKNIVSELEFRFNYEREVMLSLASLPVMKQFRETLSQVANGTTPGTYTNELAALNNLLTGFQHSVPGVDAVSVLDQSGNPLVKVYLGKQEVASQVTSSSEKIDTSILSRMRELKPHTLLYGELFVSQDGENIKPLLNPIVTLENGKGEVVGFLAAESFGDQLDHLLQVLPRSHQFKIEIVELNAANESRHGLILYSDIQNILFNQQHVNTPKLWQQIDQGIWQEVEQNRNGSFYLKDQSHIYFYKEFYPYNNLEVSWVVMLRIDEGELTAPFNRIRIGLLVFAVRA